MLHVFNSVDSLFFELADVVVAKAEQAIRTEGRFSFVLSGGSSPKRLYELLASDKYKDRIEWSKVFFFFGDERYVPITHADSNFLMAKKALFDPLAISASQVFYVNTTLAPAAAAHAYVNDVLAYFKNKSPRFDLVLLGLGDNSHTASLFPNTKVLHEKEALVKEEFIDEVGMYRITLTAPLINQANYIAFLVYGAGKAIAVHHILEDESNIEAYPAQLINPTGGGELHWFLDESAAANLKNR
jgi:6-phosphogluconolactonase